MKTKMNATILQTFFLVYDRIRNVQRKVGIRPEKRISGRSICFCECKAFVLSLFMHLLIHTLDSYPCMLILEHCDTQLRLHPFQNINDNN